MFVLISEESGSVSLKLKDVKINADVIDVTVKKSTWNWNLWYWWMDGDVLDYKRISK